MRAFYGPCWIIAVVFSVASPGLLRFSCSLVFFVSPTCRRGQGSFLISRSIRTLAAIHSMMGSCSAPPTHKILMSERGKCRIRQHNSSALCKAGFSAVSPAKFKTPFSVTILRTAAPSPLAINRSASSVASRSSPSKSPILGMGPQPSSKFPLSMSNRENGQP